MNNPKKIDLHLPRHWNLCTTEQLELIADVIREQVERQDRYHPFDMRNVKVAIFFALSGLEIVAAPDTRLDISEQYYLCRMQDEDSDTFPQLADKFIEDLYIADIQRVVALSKN